MDDGFHTQTVLQCEIKREDWDDNERGAAAGDGKEQVSLVDWVWAGQRNVKLLNV